MKFADYYFERSLPVTRAAWFLTAVIFSAFGYLDTLLLTTHLAEALAVRYLVAVPVAVLFFAFTFTKAYRIYSQLFLAAGIALIGFVVVYLIRLPAPQELAYNYYSFAISIYVLNVFILSRLRFKYAAWAAGPAVVLYLVVELIERNALADAGYLPIFLGQFALFFSALLIAIFSNLYLEYFMRRDFEQTEQVRAAGRKNERLLEAILPKTVITEIQSNRTNVAESFRELSCLFCDLKGFTYFSQQHNPTEVVSYLNRLYESFDMLCEKHGVEKIKTIGDSYMAVAGAPVVVADHASRITGFALDIRETFNALEAELNTGLDLRIGIHSGPAVAGVIGSSKFSYDVWGDTVNIASRLESSAEKNHIQISAVTAGLLAGDYSLKKRGILQLKGVGKLETYYVTGLKAADVARTG